ncbi:MAG: hypothetical protein V3W26_03945 [Thermodesulfobacteriota bacterium]
MPFFEPVLKKLDNKEIVIGIRPSYLPVTIMGGDTALEGEMLVLEPTGEYTWMDILWQGIKVKGKMAQAEEILKGETIFFNIPLDRVHIFERTTGERLKNLE